MTGSWPGYTEWLTSAAAAVDNWTPCRWIYRRRRSREEIERGDTDIIKYHGILAAAAYIDPRQRSVNCTLLELRKPTEPTHIRRNRTQHC